MVVVTIPSLAAEYATSNTVDAYARALFDFWGIGSQKDNNGILLLVSKDDHRARVELGGSWAHNYDAQTDKIMQTDIIPLKSGAKATPSPSRSFICGANASSVTSPTSMRELDEGGNMNIAAQLFDFIETKIAK